MLPAAFRTQGGAWQGPAGWVVPGAVAQWGSNSREDLMLWTIFVILLVLWLLGMVSSYTMGGFIHVLLVVAVVVALIQLIQGRKVV
jgi:hypothetical protein